MYVPKNTINHKTQGPINPKPNLTKNDDPDAADHYKRLKTIKNDFWVLLSNSLITPNIGI